MIVAAIVALVAAVWLIAALYLRDEVRDLRNVPEFDEPSPVRPLAEMHRQQRRTSRQAGCRR